MRRKKEQNLLFLKEKVYICKRIAVIKKIYRYEERKKMKALESLSDDEILQGFKDADAENDVFENVLRESGCR